MEYKSCSLVLIWCINKEIATICSLTLVSLYWQHRCACQNTTYYILNFKLKNSEEKDDDNLEEKSAFPSSSTYKKI
jgi:hypothetical protein